MALQARSAASRGMGLVAECFLSLSLFWLGLYQACCAAVASAQRVGVPVLMARPSRHSACAPVRDAHAASGLPAALQAVRMPGATPAHLAATLPPPPPHPTTSTAARGHRAVCQLPLQGGQAHRLPELAQPRVDRHRPRPVRPRVLWKGGRWLADGAASAGQDGGRNQLAPEWRCGAGWVDSGAREKSIFDWAAPGCATCVLPVSPRAPSPCATLITLLCSCGTLPFVFEPGFGFER